MLGYAAMNLAEGLSENIQWHQLKDELASGKLFLDVRTLNEFKQGRLKADKTVHIPLNELRERLTERTFACERHIAYGRGDAAYRFSV